MTACFEIRCHCQPYTWRNLAVFVPNNATIGLLIAQKWHLPVNMLNATVSEMSLGDYRGGGMQSYE